jgi:hypothetical protein
VVIAWRHLVTITNLYIYVPLAIAA